jgi:hypothetical protein
MKLKSKLTKTRLTITVLATLLLTGCPDVKDTGDADNTANADKNTVIAGYTANADKDTSVVDIVANADKDTSVVDNTANADKKTIIVNEVGINELFTRLNDDQLVSSQYIEEFIYTTEKKICDISDDSLFLDNVQSIRDIHEQIDPSAQNCTKTETQHEAAIEDVRDINRLGLLSLHQTYKFKSGVTVSQNRQLKPHLDVDTKIFETADTIYIYEHSIKH